MEQIANRQNVQAAWEAYQALAQVMQRNPHLADDKGFQDGLAESHSRWSQLFVDWDGQ
jgi:hypothetical protein